MRIMDAVGCCIMAYGLGIFTAFFLYGWLEERSDVRAGIVIPQKTETCVAWSLSKEYIAQHKAARKELKELCVKNPNRRTQVRLTQEFITTGKLRTKQWHWGS